MRKLVQTKVMLLITINCPKQIVPEAYWSLTVTEWDKWECQGRDVVAQRENIEQFLKLIDKNIINKKHPQVLVWGLGRQKCMLEEWKSYVVFYRARVHRDKSSMATERTHPNKSKRQR